MGKLQNKVAIVTGASRGMGRGIALALAEHGATVYVCGRTMDEDVNAPLPGTVVKTAEECDARGGRGIAVQVDLTRDSDIEALFDQVFEKEGRLDLLVNNAMSIPSDLTDSVGFWEKPLSNWGMFDTGVRAAFLASRHAARIMVQQASGLIVAISGYVGVTYTYDTIFGTTKSATDRMARDMAVELAPYNVASISLWQGFTFTERALKNLETIDGMADHLKSLEGSSVEFPGRVICGLLQDEALMKKSGGTFISAELAAEYGITDVDGRVIKSLRAERGAPIWAPLASDKSS